MQRVTNNFYKKKEKSKSSEENTREMSEEKSDINYNWMLNKGETKC